MLYRRTTAYGDLSYTTGDEELCHCVILGQCVSQSVRVSVVVAVGHTRRHDKSFSSLVDV